MDRCAFADRSSGERERVETVARGEEGTECIDHRLGLGGEVRGAQEISRNFRFSN